MDAEVIATVIGSGVAVLTGVAYVVHEFATLKAQVAGMREDIDELKDNVNGLIDFAMQRARVAARSKGWVAENSPVKLVADQSVRHLYDPILLQLQDTYRNLHGKLGVQCTDRQLFITIQRQFGDWISKNVCLNATPQMSNGECIDIATLLAKEADLAEQQDETKTAE